MIPARMEAHLRERLPESTWETRLVRDGSRCFIEFGPTDVDRLGRLGIEVDRLGPHLVVCMWDEAAPLPIGGYLVVDSLAMGRPSMGGIRLLPDIRTWVRRALAAPRVVELALTPQIAVAAGALLPPFPGDPADRIIYATTIEHGTRLVTRDRRLHRHDPVRTVW